MRTNQLLLAFIAVVLTAAVPRTSLAQQLGPQNATGIQPYDAYGGGRENINLGNGNLNLQIPLVSLPGRNGHNLPLSIHYDSKIWVPHYDYDPETGQTSYWWEIESGGWSYNIPLL